MKQFTEIDPTATLESLIDVLSKAKELSAIILVILFLLSPLFFSYCSLLFFSSTLLLIDSGFGLDDRRDGG